jgi:hypothetical protein
VRFTAVIDGTSGGATDGPSGGARRQTAALGAFLRDGLKSSAPGAGPGTADGQLAG